MMAKQLPGIALLFLSTLLNAAPLRDHGIDPANLGKGDWISYVRYATNHFCDPKSPPGIARIKSVVDVPSMLAYEKSLGMDYIIVKAGTGSAHYMLGKERQFTTNLVQEAHAVGLKIFGYTRSYGKDVPGEIELATYVYNCGADGFVIDAEAEWEKSRAWIGTNGSRLAIQLCEGIRARHPNWFLAHSPMPVISYHRSFPYKEFGLHCDAVMPQLYWRSFKKTPEATVDWMDQEWKKWHASLRGIYTNAIKPIAPVGPGGPGMTGREVVDFINYLKSDPHGVTETGYRGVNFFRAGRYAPDVLQVFREINFAAPDSRKNFLNVNATEVTAKSATVHWNTPNISTGLVEFGPTTNYASRLSSDSTPAFKHAITLTNLSPGTVYHFRVHATNALKVATVSADFLFLTTLGKIPPVPSVENPK